MSKTNFSRYGVAAFFLAGLLFCFCSNLGESTDLGSGVINNVDPGRTDINKHFKGLLLDSTFLEERFSVPFRGDSGFGYHNVSAGNLLLGKANKEHSAGYVEMIIVRDSTAASRFFINNDTLKSLKLVFGGDSFPVARQFDLFAVGNGKNALNPDLSQKLGTLSFNARGDTSQLDTVDVFDSVNANSFRHLFCDSIFSACSTWTADSLKKRDTLRFAVISPGDTIVQLKGACSMILSARRPADTVIKVKGYASSQSWYIVAEDGDPDTLKNLPISSFGSKRTAVYKYLVDSLWRSIGQNGELITAGFMIPNPTADSVLAVRCIVRSEIAHNGTILDSVFATESSILSVRKSSTIFADAVKTLQKMYDDGSRPASIYLYVRYINGTSEWKTVSLTMKPSFKAMITNP